MALKIELTPEEERRIHNAEAKGFDITAMIRGLLEGLPEAPAAPDQTADLFARWEAEDATTNPEEIACRNAEWEELKANLNANREAVGEEALF